MSSKSNHYSEVKSQVLDLIANFENSTKDPLETFDSDDSKQFKCKICSISFDLQENLNQHMIDVHEEKINQFFGVAKHLCRFCAKDMKNEQNLLEHFKEMHQNR